MFDILLNEKKYEYVTNKTINGKNYIAYRDNENIYISQYEITDNNLTLISINDVELEAIKEELLND